MHAKIGGQILWRNSTLVVRFFVDVETFPEMHWVRLVKTRGGIASERDQIIHKIANKGCVDHPYSAGGLASQLPSSAGPIKYPGVRVINFLKVFFL